MPIFKLSAPKTVRLLSGHILPRSELNFTHSHLDFKKFSRLHAKWNVLKLRWKKRLMVNCQYSDVHV